MKKSADSLTLVMVGAKLPLENEKETFMIMHQPAGQVSQTTKDLVHCSFGVLFHVLKPYLFYLIPSYIDMLYSFWLLFSLLSLITIVNIEKP